jgi:hypothetical protein
MAEGGDLLGCEGTDDAGEIFADVEGERERGVRRDEEFVGSEPELVGEEGRGEKKEGGQGAERFHGTMVLRRGSQN